jgi:large subunit ribosomal protein L25
VIRDVKIEAEPRSLTGKRVSRKLGRRGQVPGVLYGGDTPPEKFQIDRRKFGEIIDSGGGASTLFHFSIAGKKGSSVVIIKEMQRDPVSGDLLHADLMRISMDRVIQVKVPVRLMGTATGVKLQGGVLDFVLREVEVSCLPADIPQTVDVDVSELDLGHSLKVGDLDIPEQVKVLSDPLSPVATVLAPAAEKASAAAEVVTEEEAAAEPEVIQKGKAEEEAKEGEAEKGSQ